MDEEKEGDVGAVIIRIIRIGFLVNVYIYIYGYYNKEPQNAIPIIKALIAGQVGFGPRDS